MYGITRLLCIGRRYFSLVKNPVLACTAIYERCASLLTPLCKRRG
ncbi:hypothetical protein KSU1_A0019 [Candidatus Jettenia caeni]|uniref:Uncharacterized protein n=1 Tax=Candidatus Jettenia caeni TaxID=247490 RepID=I3IGE1_9BACT|nr:hypothetical protein KSU1_A0019 [Candidatus Jettenia caeni]